MFLKTKLTTMILWALLFSLPALAQDSGSEWSVDTKADTVLRQMSDYLNTLEQFHIHLDNSVDIMIETGQKIQLGRAVDVSINRPDRLMVEINGDIINQQLFYDGKSVTLYGKKANLYANHDAPTTIESALDFAEQSFQLVAPVADLIYKNSYDILIEDVKSGGYIGLSSVSGVECHHLAFRAEQTDWQIWIENSETPLPRKFVITSKWIAGAPQFTAMLSDWDVRPGLEDSQFTFVVPEGATEIDFLPTEN